MKLFLVLSVLLPAALCLVSFDKIDQDLRVSMISKKSMNILISMNDDKTPEILKELTKSFTKSTERGVRSLRVFEKLTQQAEQSQKNVLKFARGILGDKNVKSLWINNVVSVKGVDANLIMRFSEMSEISKISEDMEVKIDDTKFEQITTRGKLIPKVEYNIALIRAHEAWEMAGGNAGSGSVIGILDTGVRGTHEALAINYFGDEVEGYGWYDATPLDSKTPMDDNGHGTFIAGVAVGQDGIGVAPDAKWMACKGLEASGIGSTSALLECAQFFVCPHDADGNNPDCSLTPHVVNNGWGAGGGGSFFDGALNAWHTAGILPVFGMGGSGSSCGTVGYPADSRSGTFSVGASNAESCPTTFTGRGPSTHGELKPTVCCPGQTIRSAGISSDSSYTTMSGTSMASPHLSGLLAIVRSAEEDLTFDRAEHILSETSKKENCSTGQVCGGIPDTARPNNVCGWGVIDVYDALDYAIKN